MTRPSPPPRTRPLAPAIKPPTLRKHKGEPKSFQALLGPKRSPTPVQAPTLEPPPRVEPQARPTPRPGRIEPEVSPGPGPAVEPFDPLARALALPLSRGLEPSAPPAAASPSALALPDELALERLVRRFSWGGNGKRGSARIELGSGPLAGATLVLHAEGREVSIEVEGGEAHAVGELARRVRERLDDKGLVLREVSQR